MSPCFIWHLQPLVRGPCGRSADWVPLVGSMGWQLNRQLSDKIIILCIAYCASACGHCPRPVPECWQRLILCKQRRPSDKFYKMLTERLAATRMGLHCLCSESRDRGTHKTPSDDRLICCDAKSVELLESSPTKSRSFTIHSCNVTKLLIVNSEQNGTCFAPCRSTQTEQGVLYFQTSNDVTVQLHYSHIKSVALAMPMLSDAPQQRCRSCISPGCHALRTALWQVRIEMH